MRRMLVALLAPVLLIGMQTTQALACGGLVAPDGDVRLGQATTLVAWKDGVEHYLTAFAYQGNAPQVGWIVPLPAVPTQIQEGGRWTLQRLEREFNPPPEFAEGAGLAASATTAQVIEQVQVEALNITVIRGSGDEVLTWCHDNGFDTTGDTGDHLRQYAKATSIFMAAKYDVAAARARGQASGDGVPLLITMNAPHLWVPLEVLANDGQTVSADLFLMTDSTLDTGTTVLPFQSAAGNQLPGATGFVVRDQLEMNATLQHDLSSDRNMGWVPQHASIAYLSLNTDAGNIDYDLGVTTSGRITLLHFATPPAVLGERVVDDPVHLAQAPAYAWGLIGAPLGAMVVAFAVVRRRRQRLAISRSTMPSASKPKTLA